MSSPASIIPLLSLSAQNSKKDFTGYAVFLFDTRSQPKGHNYQTTLTLHRLSVIARKAYLFKNEAALAGPVYPGLFVFDQTMSLQLRSLANLVEYSISPG